MMGDVVMGGTTYPGVTGPRSYDAVLGGAEGRAIAELGKAKLALHQRATKRMMGALDVYREDQGPNHLVEMHKNSIVNQPMTVVKWPEDIEAATAMLAEGFAPATPLDIWGMNAGYVVKPKLDSDFVTLNNFITGSGGSVQDINALVKRSEWGQQGFPVREISFEKLDSPYAQQMALDAGYAPALNRELMINNAYNMVPVQLNERGESVFVPDDLRDYFRQKHNMLTTNWIRKNPHPKNQVAYYNQPVPDYYEKF